MNALNHQSIVFFGHISSSVNNEYHMVTVFDEMYIPCVRHYIENSINLIVVIRYIQETPFYLSIKPVMVYKMCGRHPWKKKHNNVLLYFDLRINKHQMYFDVIFWESCPSFKALQRPIETFKNYQNHSNRIEQY